MSLATTYLVTTKNLQSVIASVTSAKAPERFSVKFLEDLEFKSSNDRCYISLFKALGLIDESGVPLQRYYQFIDRSETYRVLAIGIQEAYEDLFRLRTDAQKMTLDEVRNKLKTLTQGQKSDKVLGWMANTFKALCDIADWSALNKAQHEEPESSPLPTSVEDHQPINYMSSSDSKETEEKFNLHYNIQIHLPETSNMAVYDAIFQSLKKHLL